MRVRPGFDDLSFENPESCHARSTPCIYAYCFCDPNPRNCKCVWSSSNLMVWKMTMTLDLEKQQSSIGSYSAAWRQYRTRRRLAILSGISFLLVPPLVGRIMGSGRPSEGIVGFLILGLLVLTIIQGWRVALWPCPKCGKAFRGTAPFPKCCRHCGLPIWSEGPGGTSPKSVP